MPYELIIRKKDRSKITREEFHNLPSKIKNVRKLHSPDIKFTNPQTGEPIRFIFNKDTLEVYSNEYNEWYGFYRLHDGWIRCNAAFAAEDKTCTVRTATYDVVEELNARLYSESGEIYDNDGKSFDPEDEEMMLWNECDDD